MTEVLLGSVALHVAAHGAFSRRGRPRIRPHHTGPVWWEPIGSPSSDAAVGFAFDEAALRGTELVAMVGWDELRASAMPDACVTGACSEAGRHCSRDSCRAGVESIRTSPSERSSTMVPQRRDYWDTGESGHQPQLIVVGSRGRGDCRD